VYNIFVLLNDEKTLLITTFVAKNPISESYLRPVHGILDTLLEIREIFGVFLFLILLILVIIIKFFIAHNTKYKQNSTRNNYLIHPGNPISSKLRKGNKGE
jgi:hypothetical protein